MRPTTPKERTNGLHWLAAITPIMTAAGIQIGDLADAVKDGTMRAADAVAEAMERRAEKKRKAAGS